MKKFLLFILLLPLFCTAQNRNYVWCFGDSAGIDFNNGAIPINTSVAGRGSCASICDYNGSILFYAATMINSNNFFPNSTMVFNSLDSLMQNGDSIKGTNWYRELVIIPMPGDSIKYYLFSIGVTSGAGFSYSIIDMSLNGGLGSVIQKNIALENFNVSDGIAAIKHGNGRDWWIALRNASNPNNEHLIYLVSPSGISVPFSQNIGSINSLNSGRYSFSAEGNKLAFINYWGLLEIYDFDRCNGILSNPTTIHPEPTSLPISYFWSCEFSKNSRFLYVSSISDTSYIFQYDLNSSNISNSRITISTTTNFRIGNSFLKRGPDDKLYHTSAWECQVAPYCFPYPDSVYNYVNMNLSVINYPDSFGLSCNYTPFSFYLGGNRTYYGLPNNPDYDLSALNGSSCDTLTSVLEVQTISEAELVVYYTPDWQTAFINANKLQGTKYYLEVVDLLGKSIFRESGKIAPPYFTKNLNCTGFSKGMYVVNFVTDKERLVKRFVIP